MFSNNSVMIDIESLDVKAGGVVLTIGAVSFNPYELNDFDDLVRNGFHAKIKLKDSLAAGYKIDADTLCWWMQQSDAARLDIFDKDTSGKYQSVAMAELANYLKNSGCQDLWSRGFMDIEMLNVYNRDVFGGPVFDFRSWRDMRTFQETLCDTPAEMWPIESPENMVAHNALHDSAYQAMVVQKIISNVKA